VYMYPFWFAYPTTSGRGYASPARIIHIHCHAPCTMDCPWLD
jgi:hypothetical protein